MRTTAGVGAEKAKLLTPHAPATRANRQDSARSRRRARSLRAQRARLFYVLVTPWAIGLLAFTVGPLGYSFYISLTNWNLLQPAKFIGGSNYLHMINDPLFWKSLEVTAEYALGTVPTGLAFALLLAVLLNQKVKALGAFRTIFYLPSVISGVAIAEVFVWVFQPQFGLANSVLSYFGIRGPGWVTSTTWALPSLIIMSFWTLGQPMIIFLAALQGVPVELHESASIDGAGAVRRFFSITLPFLTPSILFNLVLQVVNQFQAFTQAYIITDGGPLHATLFYVFYLYKQGFMDLDMGYASALSWVLFALLLVLAFVIIRTSRLWVFYQGAD